MSSWPWFRSATRVVPELLAEIVQQSRSTAGERGNNVGGWRSGRRIEEWPSAKATLAAISAIVGGKIEAWAVVHRDGSFHDWHRHDGVPWKCSGVLYMTSSFAATVVQDDLGELRWSTPVAGDIVTFPSNLLHKTEASLAERVSIAFNVHPPRRA